MAILLSRYSNDRLIQPAVEKVLSSNHPPAFGTVLLPERSLTGAIGEPHVANYALLYSLYKLNTDASGCIHKWAGGVTGPGRRITTMDADAMAADALKQEIRDIRRPMRNLNPIRLFASMLFGVRVSSATYTDMCPHTAKVDHSKSGPCIRLSHRL